VEEPKDDLSELKLLISKAKFGPRLYRELNKEDIDEYHRELKKRALEMFKTESVGQYPGEILPSLSEVMAWRKKKDWQIELKEIGLSLDGDNSPELPKRRRQTTEDKSDILAGVRALADGSSSSSSSIAKDNKDKDNKDNKDEDSSSASKVESSVSGDDYSASESPGSSIYSANEDEPN